ncbi:MAG TPA: hypothetical protein VFQ51_08670 [Vicinamibacteria bacterium]|nr:hypothetical protein [Vicinamibacteria bacterium]
MSSILESPETKPSNAGGGLGTILGIVGTALAVVSLGLAVYSFVGLRNARQEIARLTEQAADSDKKSKDLDSGLAAVRGQTKAIAERAGVTEAELEKRAQEAEELRDAQRKGLQNVKVLGGEVTKVKDDVAAQKAAIAETNEKLSRAMGDLGEQSGLIARNAEELEALKRTGLRDYYEFDLGKAKSPAPIGPVALRLNSADAKKHKFNLVLVVDDIQIEKKDKTLLEPVQFYRKGSRQLHEIVVYAVQKDRITGYLSTPKASDAAAAN